MVNKDQIAQWLAGDELKQDQFKFFHEVVKVIYDSALRDQLLNEDPRILDHVVPNLIAYHTVLKIKKIIETKIAEKKKEEEKAEREGRKVTFAANPDESFKPGMITEEQIYKRRIEQQLNQSNTSQFSSEAQKEKELKKLENEKYGVSFLSEII